ncbi:retrotransposon protein, putative, ty1-copia subclass [Tanacetum coccineum]|uniref:Retrotransposon protein, putative, ty1-copia subclass n=1 Tax=Tanacetum coccineum TaxID=301880 RepID=A0ABQ5FSU4_9ASTR
MNPHPSMEVWRGLIGAYIQELESSRIKLTHLEPKLKRARQQVLFLRELKKRSDYNLAHACRYMKSFRNSIGVKLKEEAEFIEGEVVEIQIDHRRWNAIYFDYGYLNGELAVTRSLGDRRMISESPLIINICDVPIEFGGSSMASTERMREVAKNIMLLGFGFVTIQIPMLQDIKSWLGKCFSMKDLRETTYILRITITRDRSKRLIALSQSAYLDKILKRFKMENSKRGHIPMQEKPNLSKAQGASTHGETVVKTILKYLRNTKDMVLVYEDNLGNELRVTCYIDVGFQTDKNDTKSQSRYVFILNGGAVDWKSAKQSTVAMSSTEVEYIVALEDAMETVWMKKFIDGLRSVVPTNKEPMEMLCDNTGAIAIANEPEIMKGARHYQRKYHYI